MISEPMVRMAETMHLSCVKISLQIVQIELPLHPHNLDVLLGASKMISEPIVCLAQTVHPSYTSPNIVSKRAKTRFHMTDVTL
jgi:hypothetical protein